MRPESDGSAFCVTGDGWGEAQEWFADGLCSAPAGLSRSEVVNQQLQTALSMRLIIEQAKGRLAERAAIDMDRAFHLLRAHARRTNRRLADIARAVVDGASATDILAAQSDGDRR